MFEKGLFGEEMFRAEMGEGWFSGGCSRKRYSGVELFRKEVLGKKMFRAKIFGGEVPSLHNLAYMYRPFSSFRVT